MNNTKGINWGGGWKERKERKEGRKEERRWTKKAIQKPYADLRELFQSATRRSRRSNNNFGVNNTSIVVFIIDVGLV